MILRIFYMLVVLLLAGGFSQPAVAELSPEQIQLEIDVMRAHNHLADLTREQDKLSDFISSFKQTQQQFQTAWSEFGQVQLKTRDIFAANRLKTVFSLGLAVYQETCNAIAFGSGAALGLLNKAADWSGGQASEFGGGSYYQRSVGSFSDVAKQATPELKKLAVLLKVPPEWYAQNVGAANDSALAGIFAKMREVEEQLNKTEAALSLVEKEWRQTEKRAKEQMELLTKELDEARKVQESLKKKAALAAQSSETLAAVAAVQKAAKLPKPGPPMTLGSYLSYDDAYAKVSAMYAARKDLYVYQQEEATRTAMATLQKQALDKVTHDLPLAEAAAKKANDDYFSAKSRVADALLKAGVMAPDGRWTAEQLVTGHAGALTPWLDDPRHIVWHHLQIRKDALPWIDKALAAIQQGQADFVALERPLSEVAKAQNHLQTVISFFQVWNINAWEVGYRGTEFNSKVASPGGELGWLELAGNNLTELAATLPTARDMLTKTAATYEKSLPEVLRPYNEAYAVSSELITNADNADAQMGVARNEHNELLRGSGYSTKLPGWDGVLMLDTAKLRADLEVLLEKADEAGIEALRRKLMTMQEEIANPVRRYKIAIAFYLAYREEIRVQIGEWLQMLMAVNGAAAEPGVLLKVQPQDTRLLMETWPSLESKRNIAWLTLPDVVSVFKSTPHLKLYELRHQVEQEGPGWMELSGGQFSERWNAISSEAHKVIEQYEREKGVATESLRKAYYAVIIALNKVRDPYLLRDQVARILPLLRKDIAEAQQSVGNPGQIQASITTLEQHLLPNSEAALAKTNSEVAALLQEAGILVPRLKELLQHAAGEQESKNVEVVKTFYASFREAYEARDDSRIMSFMGDEWEAGDGTTLSEMQMNLSRMFRKFDELKIEIQNMQINPTPQGFMVTYDVTITSRIYKKNLRHQEKSAVSEQVSLGDKGKPRITRTLNGRYWSVE